MKPIVSALPGRIRLRDRALRERARLERLQATLAALDGVHSAQANAATGSLLLRYDAARIDRAAMEAAVHAAAVAELEVPAEEDTPRLLTRSSARRLNTYAKVGMLGSLGASLAYAARGSKHLHAATGGLFVALLAIHLGVHRRHLVN